VSNLKPIIRRLKAAEDVEGHAMYIAEGSIDAAFRFLERAEQTIKGVVIVSS
jgi:toxin ParE1/3/4